MKIIIKTLFIGDGGVGKTTFIKRHTTGDFEKKYLATENNYEKHDLDFYICFEDDVVAEVAFDIYDMAGQEMDAKYPENIDCAIVMFDVTSRLSYNNVKKYIKIVRKEYGDIPIAVCGNKIDCVDRKVHPADIFVHKKMKTAYYDISAKSNYNFEKPFLYMLRKVTKNDTVRFTTRQ